MRIGFAVLLLGVGIGAGFGAWSVGVGTPVRAQAMPVEQESRFTVGPPQYVPFGYVNFMRDKRTGDCYLVTTERAKGIEKGIAAVTPVQVGSCQGF
jgi:hypothetical protein